MEQDGKADELCDKFDRVVKQCFLAGPTTTNKYHDADFRSDNPVYLTNEGFLRLMNGARQHYNIRIKIDANYREDGLVVHYPTELSVALPKMFSVASSSRLCYLYFKGYEKTNLDFFEKELQFGIDDGITKNGNKTQRHSAAHLDAFDPDLKTYYECKCHEIFTSHKKLDFSNQYSNTLWHKFFNSDEATLPDKVANALTWQDFIAPVEGVYNFETHHFDLKQFICHLLGIAEKNVKPCKLQYIFFRPSPYVLENLGDEELKNAIVSRKDCTKIDRIYKELEHEVYAIFNSDKIKTFCHSENHNITLAARYVMLPDFKRTPDFASYPVPYKQS